MKHTLRIAHRLQLTKTALSLTVAIKSSVQVLPAKVRPEGWCGIVLAIGRLPEQEVTNTHFSSCTNDHIRIRQVACVEVGTDQLFGNRIGAVPVSDDLANSINKLGSTTVVKANIQA